MNPASAGVGYALVLLGAGTLLGTLRVLGLAPRLGEGVALAVELPLMLAIAWFASRGLLARLSDPRPRRRAVMAATGALAFFVGEAILAAAFFGRGPAAFAAGLADPAAWPGLAAQLAALAMPALGRLRD